MGYVFHCSPCGFPHAGACITMPSGVEDLDELKAGVKEATDDELRAAYIVIKEELFARLAKL